MSKKVKKKVKNKNKNKNNKEKQEEQSTQAVKANQQLGTIVKETKNGELPISDEEYKANQKDAKTKLYLLYMIPLGIAIVFAVLYILLRWILWLVLFSLISAVVVFGWDTTNRTCPRCKKWNSVAWVGYKKVSKTTNIKKVTLLGRGKTKDKTEKVRRSTGKCTHCNHTFEKDSKSLF